jgi:hypothetical protein
MTLLELIPLIALPVLLLLLAEWGLARRRRPRTGAPFVDVPTAPPHAEPMDAPGVAAPYSSFDPWAPPKEPVDWRPEDRAR